MKKKLGCILGPICQSKKETASRLNSADDNTAEEGPMIRSELVEHKGIVASVKADR